jgi:hypothetical protein
MKVQELIAKLQEFDGDAELEINVRCPNDDQNWEPIVTLCATTSGKSACLVLPRDEDR